MSQRRWLHPGYPEKRVWSSFVERFNPRAVKVMEKESQARKEEGKKSGT